MASKIRRPNVGAQPQAAPPLSYSDEQKAKQLEMRDTRAAWIHRLNPGNVSTALDLAFMVNAVTTPDDSRLRRLNRSDWHSEVCAGKERWRSQFNGLVRSGGGKWTVTRPATSARPVAVW
jgi:hypothetical protein